MKAIRGGGGDRALRHQLVEIRSPHHQNENTQGEQKTYHDK